MYRLGKKQKRAILTVDGHEVVVFEKGKEKLAEKVCNLLNADLRTKHKICECGNELTEKEIFYETCLKCCKTI
jgi:hypothetical protein